MGDTFEVRLEAVVVEERGGLWCERCLRHSALRLRYAIANSATLVTLGYIGVEGCAFCGTWEEAATPPRRE